MSDTARRLVLLRHASAEPGGAYGDDARHLTDRGIDEARHLGRWLRENELLGEAVICSPAVRTRETWAAIQEETGHGVLIEMEPAVYEADVDTLLAIVRDLGATNPQARTAVLVGHAPGVPAVALELAGGSGAPEAIDALSRAFVPASAAVVEFDGEWADVTRGCGELTHVRTCDA